MYYGSYYNPSYDLMGILAGFWFIILLVIIVALVANWKLFIKLGEPGWKSIIPFYSDYICFSKYWGNGWMFLVPVGLSLLSMIPVIGLLFSVITLCFVCLHAYKIAEAFGEGIGFTIGLVILPFVFKLILAFDKKHSYLGVPIDGTSYKELKAKYDALQAKDNERVSNVKYETPPTEAKPNVQYDKPVKETVEEVKAEEPEIKDVKIENSGNNSGVICGINAGEIIKEKPTEEEKKPKKTTTKKTTAKKSTKKKVAE